MLPFRLEQDIFDTLARGVIILIASFDILDLQQAFDLSVSNAIENEIWDVADKDFPHQQIGEDEQGAFYVRDSQVRDELLAAVADRARDESFFAQVATDILKSPEFSRNFTSTAAIAAKVLPVLDSIPRTA